MGTRKQRDLLPAFQPVLHRFCQFERRPVRSALRALEGRERLREIEIEEYRAKIREGIESGPGIPAEDVFTRFEAKYPAMLERQV